MRKLLIGAIVIALVLTVGFTTAFAAGGRNYVDANGDGVCDNYGANCRNGGTGCRGWGRGCHGGW